MKKKAISLAATFCMVMLLPLSAYAAPAETENLPLPSGLSISELEEQIDALVEGNQETTAAMSVAVFQHDKLLLEKAYGYTNVENNLKTTEESVFEWGSCTKLITWTCVMQLVEQGKLDLNADIRTYLPEGFFKKLSYDTPITLLNLMNHSAGWQESFTDLFIENAEDVKSLEEALQYMEPEQIYEPGTHVAYSNWGTGLAGYIVERVSGQEYSNYVQEHIFTPLGMEHTAISVDLSDNPWVQEQRMAENCYESDGTTLGTCFYHIPLYPAGMATGTIEDFAKFGQAFVPTEGVASPLFEKQETLDEMLSPSLYFSDDMTARNCHGFWTDEYSVPLLWHNGGTAGSTSWFAYNVDTGVGVVILTNQSAESIYTTGILPMVFGTYEYTPSQTPEDISGMYLSLRTCMKGVAKPYTLFCYMGIESPKDGQYGANGMNMVNVGEHHFLMDMGEKLFSFFVEEDSDGNRVLQMPGADYVEVSAAGVVAQVVLLLLFVLATGYAFVMLIVGIIRLIRRRRKAFNGIRIINNIAILMSFSIVLYISVTLLGDGAMFASIRWSVIVNALCMLIPIANSIYTAVKWKQTNMTRAEKAGVLINAVAGLIMTGNVLFWNSYRFW